METAAHRPVDASPGVPGLGDAAAQLSLFGFMWAMAVIVHVVANPTALFALRDGELIGFTEGLLAAAAVALVLRPHDRRLLAGVGVLQLVSIWLGAPVVGNHWLIAGLIGAALVAAIAHAGWRGDRSAEGLMRRFAPVARITFLVAYGFVAFGKLNPAFLDPVTSCAVRFTGDLTGRLGFTADELAGAGWARAIPLGVLGIEIVIPVMLAMRRTRHAGVVLALAFHLVVGLDPDRHFWDFSATLAPIYVLFLPAGFAADLRRRVQGWTDRVDLRSAVALAVTMLLAHGVVQPPGLSYELFRLGRYLVWLVYGVATLVLVVRWLARERPPSPSGLLRPLAPALLVVPLIAFANGLTPYLEVKTAFGFNMYANLHVSGGETNHYLLPGTAPVDGRGGDLVTIVDSDDPGLRVYATADAADATWRVAWTELRSYVSSRPGTSLIYERDGQVHALERADLDPRLVAPVGLLDRKLRPLRAVDPDGHPACQDRWGPAR